MKSTEIGVTSNTLVTQRKAFSPSIQAAGTDQHIVFCKTVSKP
nr:MAG TPA: hypothetical protein [Caudoviricetes sp.]